MTAWIAPYSFFIFIGLAALFMAALLFWQERSRRRQVVVMFLFVALAGSYWQARPGAGNVTDAEMAALVAVTAGQSIDLEQPALLEAYSNY